MRFMPSIAALSFFTFFIGASAAQDRAASKAQVYEQFFAMVAIDEGSHTTFLLHNPGDEPADAVVELHKSNGDIIRRKNLQVPAGALREVKFGTQEGNLAKGWARVTSSRPLMSTELLKTGPTPWVDVLPSIPTQRFRLFGLVARPEGLRTGIAFANPAASEAAAVTVRLIDNEGKEVRTQELTMAPLTHSSGCLDDLFTGLGHFRGTAEFLSTKPLIAMSVRSDQDMLTLLPIVSLEEDAIVKQWTPNRLSVPDGQKAPSANQKEKP